MLKITVLSYGTVKESYLREAAAEYQKRITSYFDLEIFQTKGEGSDDFTKISERLLATSRAYKIALCVEGRQLSSEELAATLERLPTEGVSHVIFLIGPSDGLPETQKAMCDLRLSFSKMTFPHQLMRVILLEQVYRAAKIIEGGRYHK